jgi:hypothetical protein
MPTLQNENAVDSSDIKAKRDFFIGKYKITNPVYILTQSDLDLLKNENIYLHDLQSLDLDSRYLESLGLNESQIADYFKFTENIKTLF